jgi:hypothetical protein
MRPAGLIGPGGCGAVAALGSEGCGYSAGPTGQAGVTGRFGPTGNVGGCWRHSDQEGSKCQPRHSAIGPVVLSAAGLAAEARLLNERIYWAGPKKGFAYELTGTKAGNAYVRYLPQGVKAGTAGAQFLIVATYPFYNAYAVLRDRINAGEMVVYAPHGSAKVCGPRWKRFAAALYRRLACGKKNALIAFRGSCPKSTWVSECGVPYEIEIYDPAPAVSAGAAVESGQIQIRQVAVK